MHMTCIEDLRQTARRRVSTNPGDRRQTRNVSFTAKLLLATVAAATPAGCNPEPAIKVAICNPSMPYFAVMPERIAMNAPVGPAICRRLPPKSVTASPPTAAV